jgi:hypothetical protein
MPSSAHEFDEMECSQQHYIADRVRSRGLWRQTDGLPKYLRLSLPDLWLAKSGRLPLGNPDI